MTNCLHAIYVSAHTYGSLSVLGVYLYGVIRCMRSARADRRMSQVFTMPQVPYININIIYVCLLARMRPCSRGALRPTAATRYSNHKRYIIYRSRNTVIADDPE